MGFSGVWALQAGPNSSSRSFGSSFLKKVSIEERLRSADELPPAARKSRWRLRKAGVSGSSLRSPFPLAARRLHRNPAGSTRHGRSGLRWGSSGGGLSGPFPASSPAPRLKAHAPLVLIHKEVRHVSDYVGPGVEDAFAAHVALPVCRIFIFLQHNYIHRHSYLLKS